MEAEASPINLADRGILGDASSPKFDQNSGIRGDRFGAPFNNAERRSHWTQQGAFDERHGRVGGAGSPDERGASWDRGVPSPPHTDDSFCRVSATCPSGCRRALRQLQSTLPS